MTLLLAENCLARPVVFSVMLPGEGLSDRPCLPPAEVQWIQTALWERHRVRTLRASLADFVPHGRGRLDAETGDLTLDGALWAPSDGVPRVACIHVRGSSNNPRSVMLCWYSLHEATAWA